MHPNFPPLLLAGIEEVIGSLVGLLFLVMWIVNQIREAKKQMARPRGQQPAPPRAAPPAPAPARAQGAAPAAAGQQAAPLREQVEEFLRRARQQQQQPIQPRPAEQPARRPRGEEIEVLIEDDLEVSERRPLAEPLRPINPPQAVPVSPRPAAGPRRLVDRPRRSVAEHVAEHITAGRQSLSQQSSQLGQRIIHEDQQFDVELKSRFDHAVGTLAASRASDHSPIGQPAGESPAAQIAAMLARPDGMRQAMVLNEILRRPADRW